MNRSDKYLRSKNRCFRERNSTDSYFTGALKSHRRPVKMSVDVKKPEDPATTSPKFKEEAESCQ